MPDAGGCSARKRLARLRASAFMLWPPKRGLLFYLIALILLA